MWEKIKLKTGRTLFLSKNRVIGVQYSPRGVATTPYVVDVMDRNKYSKIIDLRYFKTKKEADKYISNKYLKKRKK